MKGMRDRAPGAGDQALRPKTIAVIAGLNKDANLPAVDLITQALSKNGHLKVLSSELVVVAARRSDYPYNIRGPYRTDYFDVVYDYSNTEFPPTVQN